MLKIQRPYLIFTGDTAFVKTALGVRDWCPEQCIGQFRYPSNTIDLGLPDMSFSEAYAAGARTLLLGGAPAGGGLPAHWIDDLCRALEAGLDIASGLHDKLCDNPRLSELAARFGRQLWDVRLVRGSFHIGQFERRSGKRLLTVGADCVVGKKYTALALHREFQRRGVSATFRATGQTGILIAGEGTPIDAVVSDFISSAAAELSPPAAPDHWDIIEGQGSLFHPAYAGVTLGLLHGSQPDAMVLCADPTRKMIAAFERFPQPELADCIRRYTEAGQLTNPEARFVGISLNTSTYTESEASALLSATGDALGLPCVDPIRTGVAEIANLVLG